VQYTTPTVHCTYSVPYRTHITLYAQYTANLCGTTPFRLVLTTDIRTRLQLPYSERNVSPCRWRQQAVTSRQHEEQCQWHWHCPASISKVPDGDDVNATGSSETLAPIYNLHGVTSQNTPTGKLSFEDDSNMALRNCGTNNQQCRYSCNTTPRTPQSTPSCTLNLEAGTQVAPKRPHYIHVVTFLRCAKRQQHHNRACVCVCVCVCGVCVCVCV
jgi:hypothetical protein